jgi:hypothetical protein
VFPIAPGVSFSNLLQRYAPVTVSENGGLGYATGDTLLSNAFQYDVTADGKHFLVDTTNVGVSAPLTLVVNWSAALTK